MKDILRASYDRSAPAYDAEFAALQRPKFEALLGPRGEALRAALGAEGRALDLGCGTGLLAAWLAEVGAGALAGRLAGVDLSRGMAARARARGVAAAQGDVDRIPFRDGSFRAVLAFTSLKIVPGPAARALEEAARVLVPGGTFAVSILKSAAAEGGAAFAGELRAAGLRPGERRECGQDWGWISTRR